MTPTDTYGFPVRLGDAPEVLTMFVVACDLDDPNGRIFFIDHAVDGRALRLARDPYSLFAFLLGTLVGDLYAQVDELTPESNHTWMGRAVWSARDDHDGWAHRNGETDYSMN
jgi:hypothetical protein